LDEQDFLNMKVHISQDVLSQEINDETVLLDLNSEAYFGLDTTGTRIWQLLQDNKDLRAVHDTMAYEFEVDPEELRKDLIKHLKELEAAGLISFESRL
jgi:Coenzyme PQQ synthesis protein D (PqqD)